ncbi:ribosome recycling factor [Oceanidesulfovibrio marinus]|uniref:Ribosome-recycling factor n=1 Tax=Oceanidesulfovibrio marinus TaxID=370038 RepID=A0A6P1ZM55_9BACT|nr:ribosome recycling factor [Oceanidesulfovibrio marinus]QJT09164.1 ribosome recycling factor [Oceanidesulfovibrio marinus]TVM36409.1 ribosome recycling factor [Oceanidesulfovibrio marinus]
MQTILDDAMERMEKAIESLERDFSKLRTGRASTTLVDELKVDYYGTPTPMNQLASISVPDSRSIAIQPWDRNAFGEIEKAIQKSDLGLNPVNDGKLIRINIPPLTEERRKELAKIARKYSEDAKIAVRNIRRDANDAFKKKKNEKEISEDEMHKGQEDVQKLTDDYVANIDKVLENKEKDIMEI